MSRCCPSCSSTDTKKEWPYSQRKTESLLQRMFTTIRREFGTNHHFRRQKGTDRETTDGENTFTGYLSHRGRESALAIGLYRRPLSTLAR